MKTILLASLLLILSCADPLSHKVNTINAIVTTGEVRTELLPRVIIDAIVLESYPKIETRIVLDYTTYLKSNKLPPANATYSVTLVRQQAPNYFFTVLATMYDTN